MNLISGFHLHYNYSTHCSDSQMPTAYNLSCILLKLYTIAIIIANIAIAIAISSWKNSFFERACCALLAMLPRYFRGGCMPAQFHSCTVEILF